jgi:hypothetical protein
MGKKVSRPPARTPEEEEHYMIGISMKAAEEKILSGKASSQLLTHFLKKASVKEQLEKEKLEAEVELLKAKKESLESQRMLEGLYTEAIKAFAIYTGNDNEEEIVDEYDSDLY